MACGRKQNIFYSRRKLIAGTAMVMQHQLNQDILKILHCIQFYENIFFLKQAYKCYCQNKFYIHHLYHLYKSGKQIFIDYLDELTTSQDFALHDQ